MSSTPYDLEALDAADLVDVLADYARPGEQHRGQLRMAYRLAETHGHRLMFAHGLGWHVWDGRRWAPDTRSAAEGAVHHVLRTALAESHDGDRTLREDVRKCETAAGIDGVLRIAATLPRFRVAAEDLDADPYLLNLQNGTLNLKDRSLQPHDPADRITRVTRGAWHEGRAPGDLWAQFLERILPDPDDRAYLQRVMGQAVFGAVREHLFPVLTGTGANGKGTAAEAVVWALGDYATILDPALLMQSRNGPGGPELMALRGARLAVGSETAEGARLDAATMKRLTGGDSITARQLYREPVTWAPSHQFVYLTNHLPRVSGTDAAVWRRVRVIPFDVVIPDEERDARLGEKLRTAADDVLAWAVAGWFAYEDGGMDEPEAVRSATDGYATESDPVRRFVADALVVSPNASATSSALHRAWAAWAVEDGADALSAKAFGAELDRLGFPAKRTKVGMVRTGLGLPADGPRRGPGEGL